MKDDRLVTKTTEVGTTSEWLLIDRSIMHVAACIWHQHGGSHLRTQLPMSMIARVTLQQALAEGLVRARGPLRSQTDLPANVNMHWPVLDIPREFWNCARWDGLSGFNNPARSELLPWVEVSRAEIYTGWPECDRRTMPAPFDAEWIQFRAAVEAIKQCFDVDVEGAYARLWDAIARGNIRVFEAGSLGGQAIDPKQSAGPDRQSIAVTCAELRSEEVIALWPELVISRSGAVVASVRRFGKPGTVAAVAIGHEIAARDGSKLGTQASAADPKPPADASRPRMSTADMARKLPSFLKERRADALTNNQPFNRESARKLAQDHFVARITRANFQTYYNAAGGGAPVGRRRVK